MYIRKQLSRKRTCDRVVLSTEHQEDVAAYNEKLRKGTGYERDIDKIKDRIHIVSQNDTLSKQEKQSILQALNETLDKLHEEYSAKVEKEQDDIDYSIRERIDELEDATRERETEVYVAESTVWNTNAVDKEWLVRASNELFQKYQKQLEGSKADLQQLRREATEQRSRIQARRNKR